MSTERNKSYPMKKQHYLEREFARRLLESDENRREQLYRECYSKMHEFYLKQERLEGKFLYRYPSLKSARAIALYLLYASILKVAGTNKKILE